MARMAAALKRPKFSGKSPSMEALKDILWPIVLVGGLGAFIDFLIGKTGQERAKDFLLKWWVRFDDVHWKNFGQKEGVFSGKLIERWFGRRIWSIRRVSAILILAILFSCFDYCMSYIIGIRLMSPGLVVSRA